MAYPSEDEDARETAHWIEEAGRNAILVPGDIKDPGHCKSLADLALKEFGRRDILVNNAAHQASFQSIEDISDEEWDITFHTNVHSTFFLCRAARLAGLVPASFCVVHSRDLRRIRHQAQRRGRKS